MDNIEHLISWAHNIAIVVWHALAGVFFKKTPWLAINIALRHFSTATVFVMSLITFWAVHLVGSDV